MKKWLALPILAFALVAAASAQSLNFTNGQSSFCNPVPVRDAQGVQTGNSYYCASMIMRETGQTVAGGYLSIDFVLPLGQTTFSDGFVSIYTAGSVFPNLFATHLEGSFDGINLIATFDNGSVSGAIGETFGRVKGPCYKGTCHTSNAILSGSGTLTLPVTVSDGGAPFPVCSPWCCPPGHPGYPVCKGGELLDGKAFQSYGM